MGWAELYLWPGAEQRCLELLNYSLAELSKQPCILTPMPTCHYQLAELEKKGERKRAGQLEGAQQDTVVMVMQIQTLRPL